MTSQSFHADMFGLMRRRLSVAAALLAALPAFAIDGVTLIDQNKTFAGNVTPGDAPGFPITRATTSATCLPKTDSAAPKEASTRARTSAMACPARARSSEDHASEIA